MNHENAFVRFMSETYAADELQDIATHGCESGCAGGMIYYSETIALFDKYRDELFSIMADYADNMGEPDTLPDYVQKNSGTFATFAYAAGNDELGEALEQLALQEATIERLDDLVNDLSDVVYEVLPYMEVVAEEDSGYKAGAVAKVVRNIQAVIKRVEAS